MTVEMTGEYRGYDIKFSEYMARWDCFELNLQGTTLQALKGKIRKYDKDERDFKRCTALMSESRVAPGLVECTVTSVVVVESETSWRGKEAWITKNGIRRKVSQKELYADTPANRKLSAEAVALYEQADKLHTKADKKIGECTKMFKVKK